MLVRHPADTRLHCFPDRGVRRDEQAPLRHAGSRARDRGRLPHGVQQHEVRDVLHGRVHAHDSRVVPRRGAILRRVVSAALRRLVRNRYRQVLVPPSARFHRESAGVPLLLHMGEVHATPVQVRPGDEPRMEGALPGGRRQPDNCKRCDTHPSELRLSEGLNELDFPLITPASGVYIMNDLFSTSDNITSLLMSVLLHSLDLYQHQSEQSAPFELIKYRYGLDN